MESVEDPKTESQTSTEETSDKVETPSQHPQKTILIYMGVSMGFGLIPVPVLDIAAVTAVQMEMLRQLSKIYDADWSDVSGRYFITSQAGVTLARLAAGAVKTIPGVGTVVGAAAQAVLSGASTFAIGQVFLKHFGEKKGNFKDFDPKEYKSFYKEQFKKGRKVAKEVGEEEAIKHEGEGLDTIELQAESMDHENVRNFLERSSDSFVGFYKTQIEKVRNWRKAEVDPSEIQVESIPEDLKVDPADIEAEIREEAGEEEGSFFSRTSDKFSDFYQNWRQRDDWREEGEVEIAFPEEVTPEDETEEDSFLEKSTDKLKDIYDSSLGKGVEWVSKLGKKEKSEDEGQ